MCRLGDVVKPLWPNMGGGGECRYAILVRERNLGGGENVMCLAVIGFSGLNPITARVVMGDLRRNRIGQEACSSAGSGSGDKNLYKRGLEGVECFAG